MNYIDDKDRDQAFDRLLKKGQNSKCFECHAKHP